MNLIKSIIEWFEIAKPEPTLKDVAMQVGVHFEEVAEMMEATNNDSTETYELAEFYKQGYGNDNLINFDHLALLDALCDQIVTAVGVGTLLGYDMEQALAEVNHSNWLKFATDERGNFVPYLQPNGKIGKNPATYQAPNLTPYLKPLNPDPDNSPGGSHE